MRPYLAVVVLIWPSIVRAADLDSQTIQPTVRDALERWRVPGAVIAVVQGNREFVGGYGVKKHDSPEAPTANTLLPLASCTKAVTTTLMAMLVDEHKLGWDDSVRKHVPFFHVSDPNVDAMISLRDLVSHRSGVRGHDLLWYRAPWDENEVFRRIDKLPVDRPFRGSYEYSTIMFMAAGRAVETRGDKPWAELVKQRVTGPLGMKNVIFSTSDPKFLTADRMTGHRPDADGHRTPTPVYETKVPNCAGSIYLTGNDLIPWLKFHLANGGSNGRRLVSAESLGDTKKPLNPIPMDDYQRRLNPDTVQMSYAMGWIVYDYRGHAVVAHGGMIDGFRVQVTLFPNDDLAIAIVNNLHDTKMNQAVTNTLADLALNLPAKDWNAIMLDAVKKEASEKMAQVEAVRNSRRVNLAPTFPVSDYAGKYVDPAYGEAEIRFAKGKLIWQWSSFVVELEHWEADTFRMASGFLEERLIGFRIGKNGPSAFRFESQVFERKE